MTNQPVHTTVSAPTSGVRSPLAVWSLVLGLASIGFGFTFVVPIAGLVLGILSRRREPEGRTMALVGIISSAVMLVGTLIALFIGLAVVGGAGVIALLPGTAA
ncbi:MULTISPECIES: DUF4190 domain-containing protein [unclassified Frigoribacterium]|uniref:DUF4190 domain-containing protein n=1 Tax=unclassified Frigoribacterium TaxID=2627005 RepID=UPI0006F9088C|nr:MULTISPECIES: DUF4190 domain-containing protein [unclassified Frigoribacterium]KQO46889.1 hypothetical protein ASF07_04230 [Frigoribacterium sp. Leaf254]KQT38982.1 hypothetical protein ASG28_04230 [Frigoribacterium sp. Leaf415]